MYRFGTGATAWMRRIAKRVRREGPELRVERNCVTGAAAFPAPIGECETRPRDFAARFARHGSRRARRQAQARRHWTLAVAGLAVVALPAVASSGNWQRFVIADATAEPVTTRPMPFEQAGATFPGSAFYYLDLDAHAPAIGEGVHSDAEDAPADPAPSFSTPARPLFVDNSGVDRTRALQCLTAAIYYEAASEPDAGQRAVAQVVLNRVAHPAYPNTVCGVVYEGSERPTGCQFTFTCDGSLARRPSRLFWDRAMNVARAALSGYVYAPVGLATHYHTVQVHPYWAGSLDYVGTIGAHRFYSFHGQAGRPGAFRFAYAGGEPVAAPHRASTQIADADDAALDPVTLQRNFAAIERARSDIDNTPAAAIAAASLTATPAYSDAVRERGGDDLYRAKALPEARTVKPEYANSGRWIAQPTN
jgi:spore germination cell wall hydrolase CwlJ-like protein